MSLQGGLRLALSQKDVGAAICLLDQLIGAGDERQELADLQSQLLRSLGVEETQERTETDSFALAESGGLPRRILACQGVQDATAVFRPLLNSFLMVERQSVADGVALMLRDALCLRSGLFAGASLAFLPSNNRKVRYLGHCLIRGRSATDANDLKRAMGLETGGSDWTWEAPAALGDSEWGGLLELAVKQPTAVKQKVSIVPAAGFQCCGCRNRFPRNSFSSSQMRRSANRRRCPKCAVRANLGWCAAFESLQGCSDNSCRLRHSLQAEPPPANTGGVFATEDSFQ